MVRPVNHSHSSHSSLGRPNYPCFLEVFQYIKTTSESTGVLGGWEVEILSSPGKALALALKSLVLLLGVFEEEKLFEEENKKKAPRKNLRSIDPWLDSNCHRSVWRFI